MDYPKKVYNINEDITRLNMRAYDAKQLRVEARILELYPDYYKMSLFERSDIRYKIEKEM